MFTFGRGLGHGQRTSITKSVVESRCPPIAGILLIVAAGGGFKQVLVDTGIGTLLADWAQGANISVLLLAWVLAVLIRLATGSATVATITASALMVGLVDGLSTGETSLVVLAIGSGSLFFSHVNDAGFWLVKEYFGLSVGQTIKSLVADGDRALGDRPGLRAAARDRDLAGDLSAAARTGRPRAGSPRSPRPRRTTSSIVPRTGTTSRPLVARAGRRGAGASRSASAETRIRSYGADSGTPSTSGSPAGSRPSRTPCARGSRHPTRRGSAPARPRPPTLSGRSGAPAARSSSRTRRRRRARAARARTSSSRSIASTVRGWELVWPWPIWIGPS